MWAVFLLVPLVLLITWIIIKVQIFFNGPEEPRYSYSGMVFNKKTRKLEADNRFILPFE